MTPKFVGGMMLIVIAACFITGILVYPVLPLTLISHWNAHGQPNGSMGRAVGTFLLPTLMLLVLGLWAVLPPLDPLQGIKRFRYIYDFFFFLLIAFLAYTYALMLGANFGWQYSLLPALIPALALLFFILGTLLPHVKRNWYFGIRTPWTLSSDAVWDKTQEFGGHLIQIAGILMLVGLFTNPVLSIWFTASPIIAAGLISIVYSYIIYGQDKHH
jgi:uncharacterized membrane protein